MSQWARAHPELVGDWEYDPMMVHESYRKVTPAPDIELEDQDVLVGCVCNGGRTYARGIMPGMCGHCHGTGSIPRSRYRAITALSSEKEA